MQGLTTLSSSSCSYDDAATDNITSGHDSPTAPETSAPSSSDATEFAWRKRYRGKSASKVWSYARTPRVGEPARHANGRPLFYCALCEYSVSSTSGARSHLSLKHDVSPGPELPSRKKQRVDNDVRVFLAQQRVLAKDSLDAQAQQILRDHADPPAIRAAIRRLIIRRDLSFSAAEWEELHTLLYACNPYAAEAALSSRAAITNEIECSYQQEVKKVKAILHASVSRIHICTDTWKSPNKRYFQAFNAHFVDRSGCLRTALLDLAELRGPHTGDAICELFKPVLQQYELHDKLGWVTGDNAGANNTFCRAVQQHLDQDGVAWPADQRRLRCFGHIINIAVCAFLFRRNEEAVEHAIRQAEAANRPFEEQCIDGSNGWTQEVALQKLHGFTSVLQGNTDLYNEFIALAGRVVHRPNETRWHSWFDAINDALEIQKLYNEFVTSHQQHLREFELSLADWQSLRDTRDFLRPFKEVCKRCEGDYVTLEQIQVGMDFLVSHYRRQSDRQQANIGLQAAITTSWYAFDKYYGKIDEVEVYVAALLLHPKRRKQYLDIEWKREWVQPALRRAKHLWCGAYKDSDQHSSAQREEERPVQELSEFELWELEHHAKGRARAKVDDFDRFVKSYQEDIRMPVLEWWLQPAVQEAYPTLWRMAIDVLSAPAMSSSSERVFSGTKRTISVDRSSLSSMHIKQLETQKQWKVSGLLEDGANLDL